MQLKLDPTITYAIALEGGGAKGAYEIGVWKALREAGIKFDAVAGTSVGALNGAMYAIGDFDKAVECWSNIQLNQVMKLEPGDEETMAPLLKGEFSLRDIRSLQDVSDLLKKAFDVVRSGGLDTAPLRSWIAEVIDPEALKNSPVQLYVTTINITDREAQEVHIQEVPVDEIHNMLLASAYHPTFKQEKLGGKNYADGGFFDSLPLHALTETGHRQIIAVHMPGMGIERRYKVPEDTVIIDIETNADLGGVLNFTSEQALRDMKIGYYDALRTLYGLIGETYYIDPMLTEQEALDLLLAQPDMRALSGNLAHFLEEDLPEMAKKAGTKAQNYNEYLRVYLEQRAAEKGLEVYHVYTAKEMLDKLASL